jgi:glucose-6-phosphate dehydrogenase assembly protein OpcA
LIIDLPDTTTSAVNRKLVDLRENGGAVALGRVLTLVVVTDDVTVEESVGAANDASREHPCRVIVVVRGNRRASLRLDAQLRVGGDAGASEVVLLRLYGQLAEHGDSIVVPMLLPDAPIVVWWPGAAPQVPAQDPIGRMAQRRVTDAAAEKNPIRALQQRAAGHAPGDTDLAWTRITQWRSLLAAALDQPPFEPVTKAVVSGASDSASTDLLAAWLAMSLKCPVTRKRTTAGHGMDSVVLHRAAGPVTLDRGQSKVATLSQPGQPDRRIALSRRGIPECLSEELRRLDPDEVFGDVLTKGLGLLGRRTPATKAAAGST